MRKTSSNSDWERLLWFSVKNVLQARHKGHFVPHCSTCMETAKGKTHNDVEFKSTKFIFIPRPARGSSNINKSGICT